METSLSSQELQSILAPLNVANQTYANLYGHAPMARQPVHVVYGGAQLYTAETTQKIGRLALKHFDQYAGDPQEFAAVLGIPLDDPSVDKIHANVRQKLMREAVEDFRIDFEDGFGPRPDAEEDRYAASTARELARGMQQKLLPPFIGFRIKALSDELKGRSLRTFDIFLTTLLKQSDGQLPPNFVVTLPKITHVAQVTALVRAMQLMEKRFRLPSGVLKMEVMIESPHILFNQQGNLVLPQLLQHAEGRCVAAHLGAYDYSSSLEITSTAQRLDHPACDFVRTLMQVAYAGTGVALCDGATNVMPVGVHRGETLTSVQQQQNCQAVHQAWKVSAHNIKHALRNGIYQGWDLHPAQIPIRYGTVYAFFLQGLDATAARLKNFMSHAAQATLLGEVFDDAATGQGLLNYFLRALSCGAMNEQDLASTGLTLAELRSRSFMHIMRARQP